MRALALASWLAFAGCNPDTFFEPAKVVWEPVGGPAVAGPVSPGAPCADRAAHPRAFFGDLHVHTGLSMDTVTRGGRVTPDEAYRFARGEAIGLPPYDDRGLPLRTLRLERPLDFAAVTDHAEWLGETALCVRPGSGAYDSDACRTFRGERRSWLGDGMFTRIAAITGFFGRARDLCGADGRRCREALGAGWEETRAAAEAHYDRSPACRFTTFHAFEYSASPGRSKVHRNVVFRNEIVPELPISWIDTPDARDLWIRLLARCHDTGTGCDALAIPHNPNLSNGKTFTPVREGTRDAQRAHAERRARLERLVEMMQAKGDSECRGGFASVAGEDEACDFEKVRYVDGERPPDCGDGTGTGAMRGAGCQSRLDFARYALLEGLREEARLGVNPYRVGFVAGTDTHNGTPGAVSERDYAGHNGTTDDTLADRIGGDSGGGYVPSALRSPGGLMGLFAHENRREALFDAMHRREAFGTSGPRIVPRFFAGDLPEDFCAREDRVAVGYARGVPMGGTWTAAAGRPLRFAVTAHRDSATGRPAGALQRIQIVELRLGDDGETFHQRVIDVAGHEAGAATVDRDTCEPDGPGASALCGTWTDPAFDPARPAVYYARVLENPSCRWTAWQCRDAPPDARPAACDDPALPWRIQERAWTSPIWVQPPGE